MFSLSSLCDCSLKLYPLKILARDSQEDRRLVANSGTCTVHVTSLEFIIECLELLLMILEV